MCSHSAIACQWAFTVAQRLCRTYAAGPDVLESIRTHVAPVLGWR
jgi:hypothetical protein